MRLRKRWILRQSRASVPLRRDVSSWSRIIICAVTRWAAAESSATVNVRANACRAGPFRPVCRYACPRMCASSRFVRPRASRLELRNRVLEASREKQREPENLHDLLPLDAAVGKSILEAAEHGNRARVVIGVIRGDTEQVRDARVVGRPSAVELAMASRGFARIDQRARGGERRSRQPGGRSAPVSARRIRTRDRERHRQASAGLSGAFFERHDTVHRDVRPRFLHPRRPSHVDADRRAPRRRARSAHADRSAHSSCRRRALPAPARDRRRRRARARRSRCGSTCDRRASPVSQLRPSGAFVRNKSGVSLTLLTMTSMSPSLSMSANAAPRPAFGVVTGAPSCFGDVLEAAVAEIPIDDLPLPVAHLGLEPLDLRIDVPVHEEQIEPPVEIEIDEPDAPSEPARVASDARTGTSDPRRSPCRCSRRAWTCRRRSSS